MGDLKTTAEERARLRCDDMFARVVVDDWTGRTSNYDQNDEVRAALDDVDTLLAENAVLRKQAWDDAGGERAEWCGRVLALEAENAKLRAVAEAARELVSESRRGGCSCTQRWRSEESTASSCACCDAEREVSAALTALEAP